MSAVLQSLKEVAADLPASERAELAQYLLTSLDEQDAGAQAAWLSLAEQRMGEVRSGKVVGIPGDEVVRKLLDPRA